MRLAGRLIGGFLGQTSGIQRENLNIFFLFCEGTTLCNVWILQKEKKTYRHTRYTRLYYGKLFFGQRPNFLT